MNKRHLLCKSVFMVLLTILLILLQSACDSNHSNIDLSQYLGKTLSEIESALDVEFTDMSQYRGFENTYRAEKRDGEFDCVIDSTGKVMRIHVLSSGKNGYSIFGVTSDMNAEAANEILTQSGISHLFDTVWCCSNKTDAVIQEGLGWSLEKDSVILEEALLRVLIEENFTYQHDDSAGTYYIGNGQVVEYYYSSFPRFVYDYEKLTEYQLSVWNDTIAGRYLMVAGTVKEVTDRGTVMVQCEDQSFDKEVGNIFPTVGFAELTLVPEQEALLMSLAENSTIVAFGRIVPDSYDSFYDTYFDLSDTIVLAVDSSAVTVPVIERPIPGITSFDSQGNLIVYENPPTEAELANQEAISALSKVLTTSELFCFVEDGQPAYAEHINSVRKICDTEFPGPLAPVRFTVVDLDQDGVTEVIVELTNNVDGWNLVLHYYNGTVYGYGFGYRAMQSIYANGVVFGSSGAFWSDAYTLQFSGYALTETPVDAETAGEPVQWYEFTQANISTALASNDN